MSNALCKKEAIKILRFFRPLVLAMGVYAAGAQDLEQIASHRALTIHGGGDARMIFYGPRGFQYPADPLQPFRILQCLSGT
jgi:hypothetical protein